MTPSNDEVIDFAIEFMTTKLSAFGGVSAVEYLAKHPDSLSFIRGTFRRIGFPESPELLQLRKLIGDAMARTIPGERDTGEALVEELRWSREMLERASWHVAYAREHTSLIYSKDSASAWLDDYKAGPGKDKT